jgi:uncharacterized repeat protein (TIGR03943 family)
MKHLRTSTVIAALCATILIRLSVSGEYSRYVQTAMRIPLAISGVVLGIVALTQLSGLADHDHEDHHEPRVMWLLLLPVLAVLAVAPPPLGGWGLDRQSNQRSAGLSWSPLTVSVGGPTRIPLPDFVGRALEDGSPTVAGIEVEMVGFIGQRTDDSFVVARYSIACCAADALASQVTVTGATPPGLSANTNTLQWVKVVGTLTEVNGAVPQLKARQVSVVDQPPDPYI